MVDIKSLTKPKVMLRHFLGCRSYFLRPMMNFVELYYGGKPVIGAEVGVNRGLNARKMMKYFHYIKRLYLIDPYIAYSQKGEAESYDQKLLNIAKFSALRSLEKYKYRIKWRFEPFNASLIPEKLDFIYIDGNHDYEPVINDIIEAQKVVKPNGIIGGHDYYPIGHKLSEKYGVGQAIRDYFDKELIHHYEMCDWWVVNA